MSKRSLICHYFVFHYVRIIVKFSKKLAKIIKCYKKIVHLLKIKKLVENSSFLQLQRPLTTGEWQGIVEKSCKLTYGLITKKRRSKNCKIVVHNKKSRKRICPVNFLKYDPVFFYWIRSKSLNVCAVFDLRCIWLLSVFNAYNEVSYPAKEFGGYNFYARFHYLIEKCSRCKRNAFLPHFSMMIWLWTK